MKTVINPLIVGGVGLGVGVLMTWLLLSDTSSMMSGDQSADSNEPLYWVAPMDPNYRRDEPGKSPMGMDLIPVYVEDNANGGEGPGTISISPDVVNNLGVRTTKAKIQALDSRIKTVGYVQYDEDRLLHIHPRVEGWIEKLHVKSTGDPVQKGQPLYALYSPQLVAAQEELLLALGRNNKRLVSAAEDRLGALQLSKAFIDQLKKNRQVKQTVTFYARQSGVVDNLNIREGFFVKPGTTLMSIGGLEKVWVEAEVFERQAFWVKQNMKVSMVLDYLPGKTWLGAVDYVYPTLNEQTRTVRLRVRFDNENGLLKPNMFAQLDIQSSDNEAHLVVPREAVIRTGKQDRVVLALGEGKFKSIEVGLGRMDEQWIEITKGLSDGESVVTSAQFLLDSESSKTSDFKRLHHSDDAPTSVWVGGEVKKAMPSSRKVSARHDPVNDWDWPAMTMDFAVADSVDMDSLTAGTSLHMELTKLDDGSIAITNTHIMSKGGGSREKNNSAEVEGVIKTIDTVNRIMTIDRGPIEKWNRPAMTMDFTASQELDISGLSGGDRIDFTFVIDEGDFIVTELSMKNGEAQAGESNQ